MVIVQAFKEFCALLFFKGALLPDPAGMLNKQGPNSHTSRRLQFTHAEEVISNAPAIKAYLDAAIDVEKSGKQVPFNAKNELTYPEELQFKLNEDHQLRLAFEGLTPGRIRGYVMHISSAKQSATRTSRIQKCIPKILKGKGFNERP